MRAPHSSTSHQGHWASRETPAGALATCWPQDTRTQGKGARGQSCPGLWAEAESSPQTTPNRFRYNSDQTPLRLVQVLQVEQTRTETKDHPGRNAAFSRLRDRRGHSSPGGNARSSNRSQLSLRQVARSLLLAHAEPGCDPQLPL